MLIKQQQPLEIIVSQHVSLVLYNNHKKIQMSNDVSKIIYEEKSIKAPLLQTLISEKEIKNQLNDI